MHNQTFLGYKYIDNNWDLSCPLLSFRCRLLLLFLLQKLIHGYSENSSFHEQQKGTRTTKVYQKYLFIVLLIMIIIIIMMMIMCPKCNIMVQRTTLQVPVFYSKLTYSLHSTQLDSTQLNPLLKRRISNLESVPCSQFVNMYVNTECYTENSQREREREKTARINSQ